MYSGMTSTLSSGRKLRHRDTQSSVSCRQTQQQHKIYNQNLIRNKEQSLTRRLIAYLREAWSGITSDDGKWANARLSYQSFNTYDSLVLQFVYSSVNSSLEHNISVESRRWMSGPHHYRPIRVALVHFDSFFIRMKALILEFLSVFPSKPFLWVVNQELLWIYNLLLHLIV